MQLGDSTAESGSNAGSNFSISRYTDAGAFIASPISINRSTGLVSFVGTTTIDAFGNLVASNNIQANGNGFKPGGGPWSATSDARIKTVTGDYGLGLDEVLALRPVSYVYKGNDTATEDGPSPHAQAAADGRTFVGLIAQEVEPIFPDMVMKGEGWIDGAPVDDLRSLDTGELIFALVNAVKTLTARVSELEAARGA
jgi:hypothetical protein